MATTFTRGQRVAVPVSDGHTDRWSDYGTVIEVDGEWVYVDRGDTTTVHPAAEIRPA